MSNRINKAARMMTAILEAARRPQNKRRVNLAPLLNWGPRLEPDGWKPGALVMIPPLNEGDAPNHGYLPEGLGSRKALEKEADKWRRLRDQFRLEAARLEAAPAEFLEEGPWRVALTLGARVKLGVEGDNCMGRISGSSPTYPDQLWGTYAPYGKWATAYWRAARGETGEWGIVEIRTRSNGRWEGEIPSCPEALFERALTSQTEKEEYDPSLARELRQRADEAARMVAAIRGVQEGRKTAFFLGGASKGDEWPELNHDAPSMGSPQSSQHSQPEGEDSGFYIQRTYIWYWWDSEIPRPE